MSSLIETPLSVALIAAVVLSLLPHRRFGAWTKRMSWLAVALVAADILLGNWRWQAFPAYALAVLMLLVSQQRGVLADSNAWKRRLGYAGWFMFGSVALVLAVVLPRAYPMLELPAPAGPFQVGLRDIHLVDSSRPETMTAQENDRREIMVRAWYPADVPEGAEPEPFLREAEPVHAIFSRGLPIPKFSFGHLTRTPGHSFLDAPVIAGETPFPVLLFSHGNSFYASQNTLLMEHLASHGYLVLGIDHPYQASWVRFPDGRVVTYKSDWVDFGTEDPEAAQARMQQFVSAMYSDSYETYYQQIRISVESSVGLNEGLGIWLDDTTFLLDLLESGGPTALAELGRQADLNRVGVFGMSLGGAAAGQFCATDERCKAGINMDGTQYGEDAMSIQLERPFLMMNADRRLDMAGLLGDEIDPERLLSFEMNDFVLHQSRNVAYSLVVAGSTHGSFSDFGVMSNLGRWIGALGSIDGWDMKRILDDYTLAFFDKHLKGSAEPLLDGSSPEHPAVIKFTVRDGREQP